MVVNCDLKRMEIVSRLNWSYFLLKKNSKATDWPRYPQAHYAAAMGISMISCVQLLGRCCGRHSIMTIFWVIRVNQPVPKRVFPRSVEHYTHVLRTGESITPPKSEEPWKRSHSSTVVARGLRSKNGAWVNLWLFRHCDGAAVG